MPTFCQNCGSPLKENAKFCNNCGAKAATEEQAPAVQEPQLAQTEPELAEAQPAAQETVSAALPTDNADSQQTETPAAFAENAASTAAAVPQQNTEASMPLHNDQKPEKSGNKSLIIQIILIVLILGVIAVDVFVLFPDKLFGKDNSSASAGISTVTSIESSNIFNV